MEPLRVARVLLSLVPIALGAQVEGQSLVKDLNLNDSEPGSAPGPAVRIGSVAFFSASSAAGIELWKTEGTTAGTQLVKDIRPGSQSSSPANLVAVGTTLFFTADDGASGLELWKSDGSAAGTVLVKNLFSGGPSDSSSPQSLCAVGAWLFFSAYDGAPITGTGRELYKSDGTPGGTVLVKDLAPGASSSSPTSLVAMGSTLLFAADDATNGAELWKSDGTPAGTVLVKNIASGTASGSPEGMKTLGANLVLFAADDGTNGVELWKTDGSTAGTVLVKNIAASPASASSYPNQLTVLGASAYFAANDGAGGAELWKSDGTTAGTTLVKDIAAGSPSSAPIALCAVSASLYFTADDGANGRELWRSDGSPLGTQLVADLTPGSSGSTLSSLTAMTGTLAFVFADAAHGQELWRSDGSAGGTFVVRDIQPASGAGSGATSLSVLQGVLLFAANDGAFGQELWRSDLTFAGTSLLKDIATRIRASSNPQGFVVVGDKAYFVANDGLSGYEVWVSDGTALGTKLVKNINPDFGINQIPRELTAFNGRLFFTADDGLSGRELWSSDGSAAGTQIVKDIGAGSGSSGPTTLTVVGSTLYFSADDGTPATGTGRELWKSDGTAAGTVLVKDIAPGSAGALLPSRSALTVLGSKLVLLADDGVHGIEPWISDGSAAGTKLVLDVYPGPADGVATALGSVVVAGGVFYFNGIDAAHGQELWKSDGTAAGTVLVADLAPGAADSLPYPLVAFQGKVFAQASNGSSGYELWKSDGTAAGTALVKDICPGASDSFPSGFTVADDRLFFFATDSTSASPTGRELWISDGSSAGTQIVKDVRAGIASATFAGGTRPFAVGAGRKVLFVANDGTGGNELWLSVGTGAGTLLVSDLAPGAGDGAPPSLEGVVLGNLLLLAADNGQTGVELFSIPLVQLGAAVVEVLGTGCPGTGGKSPALLAQGAPTIGNAAFALRLTDGKPSSPAVLLLNNSRTEIALGACTIFVTLPGVSLSWGTDAAGSATLPLPIPANPSNLGINLYFQAAVADPLGAFMSVVSISNGLRTLIGTP